jgi:hypothetical protein
MAYPTLRALALSDRKPPDLKESVRYRGGRRRYAQLTYGTGRAAAVAVVVDELAPGEIDLYVDADCDRDITAADLLTGTSSTWRARVSAVVPDGDATKKLPRTVLFRYGPVSRTLSVATCGYYEGFATLDGRSIKVRRVDGDANGLFADPQDRVWIDRNGDGTWDAATEEFLFAPILWLDGRRLSVRADALGQRLSLAPLEGTGTLRLRLPPALVPGSRLFARPNSGGPGLSRPRGAHAAGCDWMGNRHGFRYRTSSHVLFRPHPGDRRALHDRASRFYAGRWAGPGMTRAGPLTAFRRPNLKKILAPGQADSRRKGWEGTSDSFRDNKPRTGEQS